MGKHPINAQRTVSLGAEPGVQLSGGDTCVGGSAPGAEEEERGREGGEKASVH